MALIVLAAVVAAVVALVVAFLVHFVRVNRPARPDSPEADYDDGPPAF